MRALSAAELLEVWERGIFAEPTERALSLLAAACPENSPETLAALSIGGRDTCLLTLREWTFGSTLVSVEDCPACGERLELAFDVDDVRNNDAREAPEPLETQSDKPLSLCTDGYEVHFRLPNSLDLEAVAECENMTTSRQLLLDRCLVATHCGGEQRAAAELPEQVVAAIAERMAEADPGADVRLDLCCPACDYRWQATFDIVSFFWNEINTWAQRVLSEVHTLASAYGWREADILDMHPIRRQFYLDRVSQ